MRKNFKKETLLILSPIIYFLANRIQGWKFVNNFLKYLGNYLVLKNSFSSSDIIVVLGGGSIQRILTGIELYQKKKAPKLLVYRNISKKKFLDWNSKSISTTEEAIRLGVNIKDIIHENNPRNTIEEAKFFSKIVSKSKLNSAIIVTDNYHTKRSSVLFQHFIKQKNFRFSFYSPSLEQFDPKKWWHKKEDTKFLIYEYLALVETFIRIL